ncbi:nitrous oxide reductase family maturation protein NosD [Sinomicrobium soli]|uniref:nitrous oxide reductase family maturation protein NosD n=1 Tax=Sinomicrobium sp. N-1-3-6 TaxID=2219864 RepID=UPI001F27F921|nr:nitrous oxide reductase family maturation protein NosD [Sinomicrobium sp. N-1-3-6]
MILLIPPAVYGQKTEVCNTCQTRTITGAIKKAAPFDTIVVKPGTYREFNIGITKPLTIIGEGNPVIDGENKGEIITVQSDHVTIDGFTIVNVGTSYTTDYAAVRVVKSRHFNIRNNTLRKLFFGIYLEKSAEGKVVNNTIAGDAVNEYNSGNGIQLWYSRKVEVTGNTVQNVRDGIYLEFSDDIAISHNKSTGNLRYGLHFMFSNNDIYTDNLFENNGSGVAVMFSKFIKMHRNTFRKNWGPSSYGLLLKEITDSELSHNTFENNTSGIHAEGISRVTFTENDFADNGYAVKVRGACYHNTFSHNNFLYNTFDLSYSGHINENSFNSNYWSDYRGYDLDRDGTGDVPYRPVKLFSYMTGQVPEAIVLLRSTFVGLLDFSEKVSPVFTPAGLLDHTPEMKKNTW